MTNRSTTRIGAAFVLILMSIVAAPNARADDDSCSPVNLADPNPQIPIEKRPLSVMPILDQGSTDTCYAHVAAELVDAWRFSHGDRDYQHLTDPLVLAAAASRTSKVASDEVTKLDGTKVRLLRADPGNREASYKYGQLTVALDAARANGSCPRSLIMDRLTSKHVFLGVDTHYANLKKLYERYDHWLDLKNSLDQNKKDLASLEWEPVRETILRQTAKEACTLMVSQYGIEPDQLPDLRWIESVIEQDNPLFLLDEVLSTACKSSGKVKKVAVPELKIYNMLQPDPLGAKDPKEAAKKVISALLGSTHPQPISLAMCNAIFTDPDFNGLVPTANQGAPAYQAADGCAIHAAILAGRRRNPTTGICQLIIRNSIGPHTCDFKKWKTPHGTQVKWECLNGDFVMDEDAVFRNTVQISYLPDGDHGAGR